MNESRAYANPYTVAQAGASERSAFIRRTYLHLAGAIGVFIALEWFLLQQPWAQNLSNLMLGNWIVVLLAFMGVSWIGDAFARSNASRGMQYLGLGLFVVAQAIVFLPLLYLAAYQMQDQQIIAKAGLMTGALFVGLTVTAFVSGSDFSFLRGFLTIGFFVALGFIAVSLIFGMNLGNLFSAAMILLAAGSVLYTTGNIIHNYRTDQHVSAALALFSGVALMFWYILRIFMSRR